MYFDPFVGFRLVHIYIDDKGVKVRIRRSDYSLVPILEPVPRISNVQVSQGGFHSFSRSTWRNYGVESFDDFRG